MVIILGQMSLALTIAIVVIALAVRLLMPPVPGLIRTYYPKWGRRNTLVLCAVAGACAALAIFVSKR